jgi:hypothetical protein
MASRTPRTIRDRRSFGFGGQNSCLELRRTDEEDVARAGRER